MMRLVALRLRSDLDSHSRTATEGLTFQKIGKLVGIILLVSTSLAYGQFFTYSQWERLPQKERQVYLAGAFDTVVGVTEAEDPWGFEDFAALPEMHTGAQGPVKRTFDAGTH